ncbi:MAG: hypothetical protein AB1Z66_08680 [Candidatus Limnocylindrales bacterium]
MPELVLSQEMSAGPARLRVDVHGGPARESIVSDMDFLNYRLAAVTMEDTVTLAAPDVIWDVEADTDISYDGRAMRLSGEWSAGAIQKVLVTMLALRMEAEGLHPSHSSAVRYEDKSILFLGGESNHGKSMGQIEACRRGGLLISTETTVIDEDIQAVMGSKSVFLREKRAKGTERADKAAPTQGVNKFWGDMPTWDEYDAVSEIDVVVLPAIDGNFDPSTKKLGDFESQFQALHSLQNYFLTNELLAPGFPMPLTDTEALRKARAEFCLKFGDRPFYFVRAATPQVLMDEVDKVL